MEVRTIWLNGSLVPWDAASVHVLSHAAQRGSLVFDALGVHGTAYGRALFRLRDHIKRFRNSCEYTGLAVMPHDEDIASAVIHTVRASPHATAVKLCAYIASFELDVIPDDRRASLAIAAYDTRNVAAPGRPNDSASSRPLNVKIENSRLGRTTLVQAKVAASYFAPMIAKARAISEGYDDVLMLDDCGNLAEGATSNVFLVESDGVLCTPSSESVLMGITRSTTIVLARSSGLEVVERHISPEELFTASEVFLTGTSKGLRPIGSVNGRRVGKAGSKVAETLNERLRKIKSAEDLAFRDWLTLVDDGTDLLPLALPLSRAAVRDEPAGMLNIVRQ